MRGKDLNDDDAASIHDRVVFKQEDLDQHLAYDLQMRKMLIDHFWDENQTVHDVTNGKVIDRGDFAEGSYNATIRRNPDRIQVMLVREGNAWGIPLKLTKGITIEEGSDQLEIAYQIEGIPEGKKLHFAIEFNFAGMPDGQDDRYFENKNGESLGHLGETLDLHGAGKLKLIDKWLGLSVDIDFRQPTNIWAFPIRTVSQSESGFELVHQSVVVQPHWIIQGNSEGKWSKQIFLGLQNLKNTQPNHDSVIAAS